MFDLRPVGYVSGLLVACLGVTMLAPLVADLMAGNGHWPAFLESAIITTFTGGLVRPTPALSTHLPKHCQA